MFGGFVAELFPAAVRATGQGTSYNIGRMAGAVAPFTIGVLATQPGVGIGLALSLTSAFFLLAAALIFTLPDRSGQALDELRAGRLGDEWHRPEFEEHTADVPRRPSAAASTRRGWQMWVPCIGMALCSWLSFVDRQVLAILTPTIMADTGLTPSTSPTPRRSSSWPTRWATPCGARPSTSSGLRIGMLLAVAVWTGASMSHALMSSFLGFALARAVLGLGEGATFPGRPAHGRRDAAGRICARAASRSRSAAARSAR